MAKFELPIYAKDGSLERVEKRDFVPIDLFIRFQQLAEKISDSKFKTDKEMFDEIEKCFVEAFPNITAEELRKKVDLAQILYTVNDIVGRAARFEGSSKNV